MRIELNGQTVVKEVRLLGELHHRIRAVQAGPDGGLYVLTDASNGMLLKIDPPPREIRRDTKPPKPRPQNSGGGSK